MLSNELEYCLNDAFQRARDERHEFITVEHLLLALLDTPPVVEILKACGVSRTVERPQGSHAGERARRDLRREAITSGVSARLARRRPARRGQLRVARRAEDPRGE